VDGFESYVAESVAPVGRKGRWLSVYIGLAVLLAATSLVALNARGGRLPDAVKIHPRNGGCTVPFTKSVTDGAGTTTTLQMCVSQEGNITSLFYPDTNAGHQQISFDAYCLTYGSSGKAAADFGGAPGAPASFGFGPATITQPGGPNTNPITVTRKTSDNVFQVSEYIAVNFVPRSIAVVVSIKNLSAEAQFMAFDRALAPKVDGNASDDQYNEFGIGYPGAGTTGVAVDGTAGPGTQQLTLAVASNVGTQQPFVSTDRLADWLTGTSTNFPCSGGSSTDPPGYVAGGNRVFVAAAVQSAFLAPGATAKVTYDIRML